MESLKSESDIKSHVDAFINVVNEIVYQKAKEKNITPDLSRSGMSELALKSPSFYSDKINLSPDTFAEARKVYNKLGQFEYNGETDVDRIGEWVGKDSIYIGQFRKGGNIAEGIGIWVYNTGRIYEGYLKSDKAEGLGRFI